MASNVSGTQIVSSLCLMKNTTGGALQFVTLHDYDGQIGPTPYPQEIPRDQWAAFVHSGSVGSPSESIGAIVYRCKISDEQEYDWMMSWLNIYGSASKVYTEIEKAGHYDQDNVWQEILVQLNNGNYHSEASWENSSATVDVVSDDHGAIFKGMIEANYEVST